MRALWELRTGSGLGKVDEFEKDKANGLKNSLNCFEAEGAKV